MDPVERIRELETRVEQLTEEVRTLHAERRANTLRGRRVDDPQPSVPPVQGRVWIARLLLVFMTVALVGAVALTLRQEAFGFERWSDLGRALAEFRMPFHLIVCAAFAALALLAYLARRPLLFLALALATTYLTYARYFIEPPPDLRMAPETYFWSSAALLATFYVLLSLECILESHRLGKGRRRAAFLAALNSLAFFPILWVAAERLAIHPAWPIYAGFGLLAALFALFAETTGPHRNYMAQLFLATSAVLFNVAVYVLLPERGFLVALAVECLVLAAVYHASGIVVFKAVNLLVLLVAFGLGLDAAKWEGSLIVGGAALRANWVFGALTAALFLVAACYYERRIGGATRRPRRVSGHWFLADTLLDVPGATVAVLHAAAAALLLLMLTISDFGDQPALPYLLALEAAGLALLGLLLRTPQIEAGAVMIIVAAHVSYYFFLVMEKPGFVDSPYFTPGSVLLALYTFASGARWERCLAWGPEARTQEPRLTAAAPYLLGLALGAVLLDRQVGGMHAALAQNALGLLLLVVGVIATNNVVKITGAVALGAGALMYIAWLDFQTPPQPDPAYFWPALLSMLASYAVAERLLLTGWGRDAAPTRTEQAARTVLVIVAGLVGALALYAAAPEEYRLLSWLALAGAGACVSAVFMESRYRWAALVLAVGAVGWTLVYDAAPWTDSRLYQTITASAVVLALLAGSWGLAQDRPRRGPPNAADAEKKAPPHG